MYAQRTRFEMYPILSTALVTTKCINMQPPYLNDISTLCSSNKGEAYTITSVGKGMHIYIYKDNIDWILCNVC